MREYTYDELQKMQEKALARVRNMQLYSKNAVAGANAAAAAPPVEKPTAPLSEMPAKKNGGRIKMPLNLPENRSLTYPSFSEYFSEETEKEQPRQPVREAAAPAQKAVKQAAAETDEAMLLPLLLLLQNEGADPELLLALLYIMS